MARDMYNHTIREGDHVLYEGREYEVESINEDGSVNMLVVNQVHVEEGEDAGWEEIGDFQVELIR